MALTILIGAVVLASLQQNIELAHAVSCASNPCNLVPGTYDAYTGYCCTDIPPALTDSVCSCPNNIAPVVNAPCRTATPVGQAFCNRTCLNGGVCNIVSGSEVCWCTSGFSGASCELQGTAARCATSVCQAGVCVEQTIGATVFAYCYCNPGWAGATCNQCYFACSSTGVFPDTANCALGRYFYCSQASGAPAAAMCPTGQKFNRFTNTCDATYNCT